MATKKKKCRAPCIGGEQHAGVGDVVMPVEWMHNPGFPELGVVVEVKDFTCMLRVVGAVVTNHDEMGIERHEILSHAGNTFMMG